MANKATMQTSCIQENQEADECRENIPPGVSAGAGPTKPNIQVENVEGCSTQFSGENQPLSDTSTFANPASSIGGVKAKSRFSGLPSALTPIIKHLNIGMKHPSVEPVKQGNRPHPSVPFFSFGNTTRYCQTSTGSISQNQNMAFSSTHSGQFLSDTDASVRWLDDEYFPEITLLDATCDSTMHSTINELSLPDSRPATPAREFARRPEHVNMNPNSTMGSTVTPKMEISSTLSREGEMSTLETFQDVSPVDSRKNNRPSSEITGQILAETARLDESHISTEELSSTLTGNLTHNMSSFSGQSDLTCGGMNRMKACLEFTQDISVGCDSENSRTSLELSGQNVANIQTAVEVTADAHPANVTRDINSSCNGSALSTSSPFSTPDIQCNTSSKPVPSELSDKPWEMSNPAEAKSKDLQTSHDAEFTCQGKQPVLKTAGSHQPSHLNASTALNTTSQISSLQNTTLELSSSNNRGPTTETCVIDQNSPAVKADMQNTTFDNHSIQTTGGKTVLGEATFCLQNNTIDGKLSKPNSTINMSESCSSDGHQNTFDGNPPSKPNSTINMSETSSSDRHQHTLDVTPTKPNSTMTETETSSSDRHQHTLDGGSPTKPNSTITETETSSSDRHQHTLDGKSPTKPNSTITVSETSSSDRHQHTLDVTPIKPNSTMTMTETETASNDHHQHTLDGGAPTKPNSTITVTETETSSSDHHQHTLDVTPTKPNSTITEPETSSSDRHQHTGGSPTKPNSTITVTETSSSVCHQNTFPKASPQKVCNATTSPKLDNFAVPPPDLSNDNKTTSDKDPIAKMVDPLQSKFEGNPAAELASGTGQIGTKDHSPSMTDGLSDTMGHESMDTDDKKVSPFNLDDTLDLNAASLITSTPMTNCKMVNFTTERDDCKVLAAQKRLYGDGPCKPVVQVPSSVPSNIICGRKTLLMQPASKSLLPPMKAGSQLLKYKPASGRPPPLTSGLPLKRQTTQAEAVSAAVSAAPQESAVTSSSYNLRAATTGSKQPNSGLQRPQLSSIPSGILRAVPGLRPPSARNHPMSSLSTDKLRRSAASNIVAKTAQTKKHPLARGEPLLVAKKRKMDVPLSSSRTEASTSGCDAASTTRSLRQPANCQRGLPAKTQRDDAEVPVTTAETLKASDAPSRTRNLKLPATSQRALLAKAQSHGCGNCGMLEQRLKMQEEEIRRLKEELLKYKQDEEC